MTRHPLVLALALAALVVGACAVSVVGLTRPEPVVLDAAAPAPSRVDPSPAVGAAAVLRSWDTARSEAWARGDVRRLARLYTPGSPAGRADLAMLRAWTAQILTVEGMATQLIAVDEVSRTADTWTLRVTDRLAAATAVGPGVRRALPRDAATSRTVELRLVAGEWRVASVRSG